MKRCLFLVVKVGMFCPDIDNREGSIIVHILINAAQIVLFHINFSPSVEQPEYRK